jgi:hypothetical protein
MDGGQVCAKMRPEVVMRWPTDCGANNGRRFYSCGKYSIMKSKGQFFFEEKANN